MSFGGHYDNDSPAAIPYSRGKIAEQAAAVKGKMNGYVPPLTAWQGFAFCQSRGL